MEKSEVWVLRLALFPHGLQPGRYKVNSWVHLRLWQLDVALTFLHRFGMIYRGPWKDISHHFMSLLFEHFPTSRQDNSPNNPDILQNLVIAAVGTPVHNLLLAALGAHVGHGARLQMSARASCQLLSVAGCVVEDSSVKWGPQKHETCLGQAMKWRITAL